MLRKIRHIVGDNDQPGVEAAVALDSKSAADTCTPDVSDDTLRQAVEDAGYHVPGSREFPPPTSGRSSLW